MSLDATIEEIQKVSTSGTTSGSLAVDNNGGVVDDTWIAVFASATTGSIFGANTGHVHDFTELSSEMAPTNADGGGNEYFSIPGNYFTGSWLADDTYSFKTTKRYDQRIYIPNHYLYQLGAGAVNLSSDTIKAMLCDSSLTFDIDSHATKTDVDTYELTAGSGYTSGGETLVRDGSWTEDDTEDQGYQEFNDIQWTASGGSIGPFLHVVFYDDDTSDDTIIACLTFRSAYTIADGNSFYVKDPISKILGSCA